MNTIDEVHAAPLGYEYDRIVGPARKYDADVLYLLEHDDRTAAPDYHDDLRAELADLGVTRRACTLATGFRRCETEGSR